MTVKYHAELQSVDYLLSVGCQIGPIGISKYCCELCTAVLSRLNRKNGYEWKVSGCHRKFYMARLPFQEDLASSAKEHVDQVLITQIKNACRGSESPPLEFIGIFAPPGTGHSRLDISKFFSRVDEE